MPPARVFPQRKRWRRQPTKASTARCVTATAAAPWVSGLGIGGGHTSSRWLCLMCPDCLCVSGRSDSLESPYMAQIISRVREPGQLCDVWALLPLVTGPYWLVPLKRYLNVVTVLRQMRGRTLRTGCVSPSRACLTCSPW